ncbi:unnamed protein product [Triticum turgidum subsp. durum]|uniref:Isopenicillin N synthase-like Fe(2+) 2OG dioxygenase domain-containing protein n=1 Tax=Triticum turgidum subsp. durum TaxID=4567 RepID=A0A9R1QST3_TRITD|nr:unnamed protein product [Triticum turgidum subsp. durum]
MATLVFDAAVLSLKDDIPPQFVWPADEAPSVDGVEEIAVPVVDIAGFLAGDGALPLAEKQRAQRRLGENHGYAGSFVGRFGSKLPWKETMSFNCSAAPEGARKVVDYFVGVLGEEYRDMGGVWQEYCDEMTRLALDVTDVLAACLGLRHGALRGFFAGDDSLMRLNHYPPCQKPHLTRAVRPRSDAFVVNIGDTFSALTNGRHISCLHRAVVNSSLARRSLTFFLNPQLDRLVAPPPELLAVDGRPRVYPDFTWREFLEFTQKHYRSDWRTLDAFASWINQGRKG